MGGGRILLDGPAIEVLAQEEILATTYVEPPQLTRLGNRLDFPHPVRNVSPAPPAEGSGLTLFSLNRMAPGISR